MDPGSLPAWSAFGPGASQVAGWVPAASPFPRTSARVEEGRLVHGEAHLARLQQGAIQMGWNTEWLPSAWRALGTWLAMHSAAACRLQLHPDVLVVRGESRPAPAGPYLLKPMFHPLGDLRKANLASFKGLLGPWDRKCLDEAAQSGASDVLLHWPDGTIAETAIAACGLLCGNDFRMPPREGRVHSIAEALDLPEWAEARGWRLVWGPLETGDFGSGQIWCMNAVRGLWQAETIEI